MRAQPIAANTCVNFPRTHKPGAHKEAPSLLRLAAQAQSAEASKPPDFGQDSHSRPPPDVTLRIPSVVRRRSRGTFHTSCIAERIQGRSLQRPFSVRIRSGLLARGSAAIRVSAVSRSPPRVFPSVSRRWHRIPAPCIATSPKPIRKRKTTHCRSRMPNPCRARLSPDADHAQTFETNRSLGADHSASSSSLWPAPSFQVLRLNTDCPRRIFCALSEGGLKVPCPIARCRTI